MPYASFSCDVEASVETLWRLLEDKIENPGRYLPGVEAAEILERGPDGVLHRLRTAAYDVTERIAVHHPRLEIDHALVDHPHLVGSAVDKITPPREDDPESWPLLTVTLDWRAVGGTAVPEEAILEAVTAGVLRTKELAEAAERAQPAGET